MRKGLVIAALCAGAAFATSALAFSRQALWRVDQACVASFRLTGLALPCLDVHIERGVESGYIVLRPPFIDDTIIAPTARITGLEDPFLATAAAANYIEDAWRERAQAAGAAGRSLAHDDFALAINSRDTRSQDQLHVHLGCLSRETKARIATLTAKAPSGAWTPLSARLRGLAYAAYPLMGADLARENVLRLVLRERAALGDDPSATTLAVAGVRRVDGTDGFVALVAQTTRGRGARQPTAEMLLEPGCAS